MTLLTVATCVTVTALALAIVVVHSLKFARWAIEREDRLAIEYRPITTSVRKLKLDTLVKQRKQHEERWHFLLKSGFDAQARDQQQAMERVDTEMVAVERAEVVDKTETGELIPREKP